MKVGWKIRKLWHLEVSGKHRYEYACEWVDDVIASLLAMYFVHKIVKIVIFCPNLWYFAQTCDSMSLISRYIGIGVRDQFRLGGLRSVARIFSPLLARKSSGFARILPDFLPEYGYFENSRGAAAPPPRTPMYIVVSIILQLFRED